jgi:hypothetical protein
MVEWTFRPLVQKNPELAWELLVGLATRLREVEARAAAA